MPYSLDLRQRAVSFVEGGGSVSKAARIYHVGRATIYRWLNREDLAPTQVVRRKRKLDWEVLRKDVEQNPESKLVERAEKFGVSVSAISHALKKMKITRKKRTEISREKFRRTNSILSNPENLDSDVWGSEPCIY